MANAPQVHVKIRNFRLVRIIETVEQEVPASRLVNQSLYLKYKSLLSQFEKVEAEFLESIRK